MTYIYKRIDLGAFINQFYVMGRDNQFSPEGRIALFNYLEEIAEDTGEPIELDVIALCCEFTEYVTLGEYNNEHGADFESWDEVESLVATFNSGISAITHNY